MAKLRVFASFDFDHDHDLKGNFVAQAALPESPFSFVDVSLKEAYPDKEWLGRAQRAISKCDVLVVLLGPNTHSAEGVLQEINIAKGAKKRICQLQPRNQKRLQVKGAGPVIPWKWTEIYKWLYEGRTGGKPR